MESTYKQKQIIMTKEENKVEQINTASAEKDMDTKENSGYSVIIEGEEIEKIRKDAEDKVALAAKVKGKLKQQYQEHNI